MAQLGKTAIGASLDTTPAAILNIGGGYTFTENGVVTMLTWRLIGTGTQGTRGIIYSDSAGPSALLATTPEVTITTSEAWYDMPLSVPIQVNNGVKVWIGFWTSASTQLKYDTVASSQRFRTGVTYASTGNAPDPFGAATTGSENISGYMTYTPLTTWEGSPGRPTMTPLPVAVQRAALRCQAWRRGRSGLWCPAPAWVPGG